MVGPSLSDEERQQRRNRLKAAFVLLVGGSAGMIAVQGGADPISIAVVTLAGLLLGTVLIYYLSSIAPDPQSGRKTADERRSVDFGEDEDDRRNER